MSYQLVVEGCTTGLPTTLSHTTWLQPTGRAGYYTFRGARPENVLDDVWQTLKERDAVFSGLRVEDNEGRIWVAAGSAARTCIIQSPPPVDDA